MKLVLTLLVRDEADIVEDFLRYHLELGVDLVIATDHRSQDGTTDVLRSFEREGHVHLIEETSPAYRQAEYVTRMARLAAVEHAADWVINSDADEFWWPRTAPMRELLDSVPPRFGVVHGLWRHFALRPESDPRFSERMTVRRRPAPEGSSPYVGALKSIHRAHPEVVVGRGNHKVFGPGLVPLREWIPVEVLHFPIRTRAQLEWKYRREQESVPREIGMARHVAAAVQAFGERGVDEVYAELLVDDATLSAGLADGTLAVDTRVRDALRALSESRRPALPTPTVADDVALAEEAGSVHASDSVVRLGWHIGRFQRRLAGVGG
jgi:hypothetical protein